MWSYEKTVTAMIHKWLQKDVKKKDAKDELGDEQIIHPSTEKFGICVFCLEAGREPNYVINFGGERGINSHRKAGPKGIGGQCCNPFLVETSHYEANTAGQMHPPVQIETVPDKDGDNWDDCSSDSGEVDHSGEVEQSGKEEVTGVLLAPLQVRKMHALGLMDYESETGEDSVTLHGMPDSAQA
ncbi:hypothetical protein B484DRAFT_429546 [Ochromonadaceae sp. CCMP2298]|nr:hypothetical protein B484DRAFT_429546 [Ochromonadaceae sp. CCMP2298]